MCCIATMLMEKRMRTFNGGVIGCWKSEYLIKIPCLYHLKVKVYFTCLNMYYVLQGNGYVYPL